MFCYFCYLELKKNSNSRKGYRSFFPDSNLFLPIYTFLTGGFDSVVIVEVCNSTGLSFFLCFSYFTFNVALREVEKGASEGKFVLLSVS